MISAETMKARLQEGEVAAFDLIFWKGTGRVVNAAETLSLQVRGKRADYTWDRVRDAWLRLQANQELTVDELGGGHDAVGLVSLFAALGQDEIEVAPAEGVLRLPNAAGRPVRPHPGALQPPSWAPLQRKIDGD